MDHQLNLIPHIKSLQDRLGAVMRAITSSEGGTNFMVLKTFYIQAISSTNDYTAPLLATTSPCQMEKIGKMAEPGPQNHEGSTTVGKNLQHEG